MPTVFEIIFRGILKILLKVPKTSEIVLCLFFFLSGNHGDHEKPLWVSGYRGQGWEKEFRPSALKSIPKPKLSQACPRPAEDQGQVQFWNTRRKQAPRLWNSLEHHHCGSYAGRRLVATLLWSPCLTSTCDRSAGSHPAFSPRHLYSTLDLAFESVSSTASRLTAKSWAWELIRSLCASDHKPAVGSCRQQELKEYP